MARFYMSLFRAIIFFFSRILITHFKTPRYLHRTVSNVLNAPNAAPPNPKLRRYPSFLGSNGAFPRDDDRATLVFNVEETLLKSSSSSSLLSYFLLVAFEAGSPARALALLALYPLMLPFSREARLKAMVFVSFFGVKSEGFVVGRAVLPKYFLEGVGLEGFEVVNSNKCRRRVGVSELPQVMIESFVREYLGVDHVVGKELKVLCGYFVGLMEEDNDNKSKVLVRRLVDGIVEERESMGSNVIGINGSNNQASLGHPLFAICKEIYLTNEEMKRKWQDLPRERYPKAVIFHDGRLALKPTPLSTLTLFIWLPFGILLAIFRTIVVLSLPQRVSTPILALTGMQLLSSTTNPTEPNHAPSPSSSPSSSKGGGHQLYVCNHRTLLDPLYLSFALKKPLTAVTYSLSRVSEIMAPIRTVRLSRDRDRDGITMKRLLSDGDLVICPEGTTCREPFLLRFSPLFAEMSREIVPVAVDCHVTMFYGTTASGLKCFDPLFFLMNPRPSYTVRVLGKVPGVPTCPGQAGSRFEVANHVQGEIGEALGFGCTRLTRKDKYLVLAGNHGVV